MRLKYNILAKFSSWILFLLNHLKCVARMEGIYPIECLITKTPIKTDESKIEVITHKRNYCIGPDKQTFTAYICECFLCRPFKHVV